MTRILIQSSVVASVVVRSTVEILELKYLLRVYVNRILR
jgi:hypothetical protein